MNTLEYKSGLAWLVKTSAEEDQHRTAPGLTRERALAFLKRDLPMSVIPMGVGMAVGEGTVRALNKRMLASGKPLPTGWRYGIPAGAAALSVGAMLMGHAHSRLLQNRAREIPGPESRRA